jgi:ligand-binding SRPBCC domain-containing protein
MSPDRAFDRLIGVLAAGSHPAGDLHTVRMETIVPMPLDETFAFFSDAVNLERLTPPWINFTIRTPLPIEMREGATIDYRISLYGLPIPWRTRIDVWEPGVRFVDRQVAGPYRWWRHEHLFAPHPSGTRVIDLVEYAPRAAAITRRFVQRDVERIFAFRQSVLARLVADDPGHGRVHESEASE